MKGCEEVREDLPALALGALTSREAQAVHRHLRVCPTCAALWAEIQPAAELLSLEVPPVPPPPEVKARVLAQVQRRRKLQRVAGLLAPVAAGALVAAAALALRPAPAGRLQSLLADPSLRVATLRGSPAMPHARARVFWSPDRHMSLLVATGLKPLPAGQVYQVWLVKGNEHVSAGVFRVGPSGTAMVQVHGWMRGYPALGVTREPFPGTSRPTTPRLLGGRLRWRHES